jgi:hypothetical protein
MRGLYQFVDALFMTIAPTPSGVSGKYYDKIEQQPEVLCSTFASEALANFYMSRVVQTPFGVCRVCCIATFGSTGSTARSLEAVTTFGLQTLLLSCRDCALASIICRAVLLVISPSPRCHGLWALSSPTGSHVWLQLLALISCFLSQRRCPSRKLRKTYVSANDICNIYIHLIGWDPTTTYHRNQLYGGSVSVSILRHISNRLCHVRKERCLVLSTTYRLIGFHSVDSCDHQDERAGRH